jgi:hypothetical protein
MSLDVTLASDVSFFTVYLPSVVHVDLLQDDGSSMMTT